VSGGIYIDGPARIGRARVYVQRENKMLFRSPAIWRRERIDNECARCEIDNRRTGDPDRIDITAPETA
jgi:hypothetical protein